LYPVLTQGGVQANKKRGGKYINLRENLRPVNRTAKKKERVDFNHSKKRKKKRKSRPTRQRIEIAKRLLTRRKKKKASRSGEEEKRRRRIRG